MGTDVLIEQGAVLRAKLKHMPHTAYGKANSKYRKGGREEICHYHGKERQIRVAGACFARGFVHVQYHGTLLLSPYFVTPFRSSYAQGHTWG